MNDVYLKIRTAFFIIIYKEVCAVAEIVVAVLVIYALYCVLACDAVALDDGLTQFLNFTTLNIPSQLPFLLQQNTRGSSFRKSVLIS